MEKQIKQSSLKWNFVLNTFLQIINIVAPLLTTPYVSRVLGVEQIGIYSYTYSINYYFVMVAGLGTATYGIIEIAKVRDNPKVRSRVFWAIEFLTIITSFLCIAFWIIISILYREFTLIMLSMTFYILAVTFDISWFYLGIEKVKYSVGMNSFFKLLAVPLIFYFVKTPGDLVKYAIILSGTMFIGNASIWFFLPNFINKSKVTVEDLIYHFRGTILYFIPTIATSVYTVLGKTLIGVITHDNNEIGYYEQATKIITLIKTVTFTSLNTLLGSRMAYLFAHNNIHEIQKKRNIALDYMMLLGIGACFGLIGVAYNFVPLFFGEEYVNASLFLILMSPLLPIMGMSNLVGNLYYNPTGQRKKSTIILVIGCGVNIGFNILFVPFWGGVGSIIASLIAEVLITILYIVFSKKFVTFFMILTISWKKIISGSIMLLYTCWISDLMGKGIIVLAVQCIGGVGIYFLSLIILKDKFVLNFIKKILLQLKVIR